MILAGDLHFEGVLSERTDFDLHGIGDIELGERAQMPGDVRGGIALEIARRHPAEVQIQQRGPHLRTLAAHRFQQIHHHSPRYRALHASPILMGVKKDRKVRR